MYRSIRKNDNPPPGAYDTVNITTSKNRSPHKQGFSALPRVLHCPVVNPETEPGQYDPKHMRGDTPNGKAADLKRGGDGERVPLNKNRLIAPPPGSYDAKIVATKRLTGLGFGASTENRFGDALGYTGSKHLTKLNQSASPAAIHSMPLKFKTVVVAPKVSYPESPVSVSMSQVAPVLKVPKKTNGTVSAKEAVAKKTGASKPIPTASAASSLLIKERVEEAAAAAEAAEAAAAAEILQVAAAAEEKFQAAAAAAADAAKAKKTPAGKKK